MHSEHCILYKRMAREVWAKTSGNHPFSMSTNITVLGGEVSVIHREVENADVVGWGVYSIGSKPWKLLCEESSDQVCDCAGEVLGVVNGVDMIGFVKQWGCSGVAAVLRKTIDTQIIHDYKTWGGGGGNHVYLCYKVSSMSADGLVLSGAKPSPRTLRTVLNPLSFHQWFLNCQVSLWGRESVTVKTFGLSPDRARIWLDFPDFKHDYINRAANQYKTSVFCMDFTCKIREYEFGLQNMEIELCQFCHLRYYCQNKAYLFWVANQSRFVVFYALKPSNTILITKTFILLSSTCGSNTCSSSLPVPVVPKESTRVSTGSQWVPPE